MELEKFFDKVNYEILMYELSRNIKDKWILSLIGKYIQSGIMVNSVVIKNQEEIPQGGWLSPLRS